MMKGGKKYGVCQGDDLGDIDSDVVSLESVLCVRMKV